MYRAAFRCTFCVSPLSTRADLYFYDFSYNKKGTFVYLTKEVFFNDIRSLRNVMHTACVSDFITFYFDEKHQISQFSHPKDIPLLWSKSKWI